MHESHQRALRLRAQALEASSDGIGITDATGHYLYLNPAHRRMFGIAAHEDVGKLRWHDIYDEEERRRITERAMPRLMAEGAWHGRTRGRRRDGTMVEQDIALSLTDDGGILCITRDITRQRELEAERRRLRDELQVAQRRETVAQLASGVAHDLNNLVAVVSGTVALLETECEGDETVQTGLDRITRSMDAARDLVAGLGDVSRPASPRAIFDLRQVVDEAVDLLGSERIERHTIETVLPEAEQPVWANRTALLQVALNLALNACESGEDPKVTLSVGPELADQVGGRPDVGTVMPGEDYAFFSVSDTGEGVDPQIRPRLFERYMTTKGESGTGLGLPIIAGILKENGGVLWFDSVPGRGSTVTVAWPATRPGIETPRADARDAREQGNLAGQRVLVVDDMPDVAAVLSGMLEAAGANPIAVSDPEDAMRLLESGPGDFAVLVTDLDMPGIGGIEVARIAAQQDPPVPCVLVTAKGDRVGRHQHLFHRVLAKPVEAVSFARAVEQAARSRGHS
jgi:PAS domain S-box-containing protein